MSIQNVLPMSPPKVIAPETAAKYMKMAAAIHCGLRPSTISET